jgi:high-affinity iron transporter
LSIQLFLIASTSVLYLIAAGMFSKAIWSLQFHVFSQKVGSDVAEEGVGPGSYNTRQSVWHVNCCNPEIDNGWDVFQALLGWQNSATYGSVISYNMYWIGIMVAVACMLYEERTGSLPLRNKILGFLVKVPGLKGWAQRKQEISAENAAEIVRLGQAHLAGGVFHDSEAELSKDNDK